MKIKYLQLKFLKYNFKNLEISGILFPLENKNNMFSSIKDIISM